MKWELHFNVWLPPAPHKKRKAHHNMFKGYFLWIGDVSLAWETHQEFISDEVLGPYKIFILTGLHTNWKKQTQTWWFATKRGKKLQFQLFMRNSTGMLTQHCGPTRSACKLLVFYGSDPLHGNEIPTETLGILPKNSRRNNKKCDKWNPINNYYSYDEGKVKILQFFLNLLDKW